MLGAETLPDSGAFFPLIAVSVHARGCLRSPPAAAGPTCMPVIAAPPLVTGAPVRAQPTTSHAAVGGGCDWRIFLRVWQSIISPKEALEL